MKLVSIILPTYNRAPFLANAVRSIRQQTWVNWELIVVDDGSTDDSLLILKHLLGDVLQYVNVISQKNQGPAVARNNGIDHAKGQYIAFFDSDDTWDDEHLTVCVEALEANLAIDWVYCACRRKDLGSGKLLVASTFYTEGKPNPLFECAESLSNGLFKLDPAKSVLCQLTEGIDSGLQNSVIRSTVFSQLRIPEFRIGEDRLFILQALKTGFVFAFIDKVTVTYYVHDNNSSDTDATSTDYPKRIGALKSLIESYEYTPQLIKLTKSEKAALNRRLSEDYVWKLGYSLYLQCGEYDNGIRAMWRGIRYYPYKIKYWKSLISTYLKRIWSIRNA